MILKLNPRATFKAFPKEGIDKPTIQMPLLIQDGRFPIGVSGTLEQRSNALTANSTELILAWGNQYFFTGDGLFEHPDGENIKVGVGAQLIRDISPDTSLFEGAIQLGNKNARDAGSSINAYDALQGETFTRSNLERYGLNRRLSKKETLMHPVWKILVPEKETLKNTVTALFEEMALRQKVEVSQVEGMGIYLARAKKFATGRLWVVLGLGSSSNLAGDYQADCLIGRLVGAAPEALVYARDSVAPSIDMLAKKR